MKKVWFISFIIVLLGSLIYISSEGYILKQNKNKIDFALEYYLNNNLLELDNLHNDKKITLKTLANEGLIDANLNINYNDTYYTIKRISLNNEINVKAECEDSISVEVISDWIKTSDKSRILYFCNKKKTVTEEQKDPYDECTSSDNDLYCKVLKNNINNNTDTTYREDTLTEIGASTILSGESEKTLSTVEDNYGLSYYYRGDVADNYVKFNNMCWRIVRIQGDGSIKLILKSQDDDCINNDSSIGDANFGGLYLDTYDVRLNFEYGRGCYDGSKTSYRYYYQLATTLKDKLEDWFSNFSEESKQKLKKENYCLGIHEDIYNNWTNGERENSITPENLKCENLAITNSRYVGTITIEEATYAGVSIQNETNTFLNTGYDYYTMSIKSPKEVYYINSAGLAQSFQATNCKKNNTDKSSPYDNIKSVRPVIVLNKDVKFVSGNGTVDNPYVVG